MGGCAASKLIGGAAGDDDPVAVCRERKRLLKSAVERRHALAEAHGRYIHSLNAVAAAIDLFVARHSAPVPVLLTLPSDRHHEPSFLIQAPSEPKTESFAPPPPSSSSSSSSSSSELVAGHEMGCGYYAPPSPAGVFGWDFFNPFDGVRAAGLYSEDELKAVREQEGIPELEVVGEAEVPAAPVTTVADDGNSKSEVTTMTLQEEDGKEKGLAVLETTSKQRELLDALRDVEDQFIRACDSGKDVSRMLEVSSVHLHPGLDELKDNSSKLIQAITWHRSPSSLSSSSSYRSNCASSSKDTLLSESRSDLFDNCGGMASGSHSQTLGRLYAWEKKLYEEVKVGDQTRQAYEKKCVQLRNQDAKGAESRSVDKTRAVVRDLYTRIWVALRSADTISKKIQKVRDEELHPQLIELLQGLMKSWKIMLESHEIQKEIMSEVTSFTCPTYGKFCSDSQRLVTLQLETELQNWSTCFRSYVAELRAYIEALDGWLSKFFTPDIEFYTRGRSSLPSYGVGAPALLVVCHDWLSSSKKLPDKAVSYAMKGFIRDMKMLWVKQGEEQQQKGRVDILAKELDRRVLALQKAESRVLELKLSELKPEPDVRQRMEYVAKRKDLIDMIRKKLDAEKAKHHDCMQETQRATLNGFKTSLTKVFESLAEFSKDSLKLYDELLIQNEKAKAADETAGKSSCIEGSRAGDNR